MTGTEFFRTITKEILDYVMREMLDPAGVQMLRMQHLPSSSSVAGTAKFYSTQDADSEGEEGKFFVQMPDEIREVAISPVRRLSQPQRGSKDSSA